MNCAEIEILICDYVDGMLPAAQKAELELHFTGCQACAELAKDSAAAVAFMETAADVEPAPELITRILFDPPWSKEKTRSKSFAKRVAGWFSLVLQPKFAMGAAMTILSFSLLSQMAPVRNLRPSDFEPAKVWNGLTDRISRVKDRTQMFIESLKFVYQIQTTLHEWQQQNTEQQPAQQQTKPDRKTDEHKLPANSTPVPSGGVPAPDANSGKR
jgi:Putative zinc-finger